MLLLYYHTQAFLGEHYLLEEPLGPSLGIQAQLPVLLAEYNFYNNQDITDYLNLLCSTKDNCRPERLRCGSKGGADQGSGDWKY